MEDACRWDGIIKIELKEIGWQIVNAVRRFIVFISTVSLLP